MPKVSVILTSFNHAQFIAESIESVLGQTWADFELIVIDDHSSDDSWSIVTRYTDKRMIPIRNEKQMRGIWGINKIISEQARGEYIAIHHSDDVWEPDKLEKQVAFLDANPGIGAVFTRVSVIAEDGTVFGDASHPTASVFDQPNRSRHEWLRHFFYEGNALCHPSLLIRKRCYDDCGLYTWGLGQLGDFDMWIRLCLRYEIHVLQDKLVRFRVRNDEQNMSGNRPDARIRYFNEFYWTRKYYLRIGSFEDMAAVFPSAAKYHSPQGFDAGFVLAMTALEEQAKNINWLFGLSLLHEIVNNPERAKNVASWYGFDYRDLIRVSARHDVFSLEILNENTGELVRKHDEILRMNREYAKLQQENIAINQENVRVRDENGRIVEEYQRIERDLNTLSRENVRLNQEYLRMEHENFMTNQELMIKIHELATAYNSDTWRVGSGMLRLPGVSVALRLFRSLKKRLGK